MKFTVLRLVVSVLLGTLLGLWVSTLLPDVPLRWVSGEVDSVAAIFGGIGGTFFLVGVAAGLGYAMRLMFEIVFLRKMQFDVNVVVNCIEFQFAVGFGFILLAWYLLSLLEAMV